MKTDYSFLVTLFFVNDKGNDENSAIRVFFPGLSQKPFSIVSHVRGGTKVHKKEIISKKYPLILSGWLFYGDIPI
jgi:hypothetical protein